MEVCVTCGAVEFGNATCRDCVSRWPNRGISQETVDRLLATIGDQPPARPVGAAEVERFLVRLQSSTRPPGGAIC
jgi:hypothetical protein